MEGASNIDRIGLEAKSSRRQIPTDILPMVKNLEVIHSRKILILTRKQDWNLQQVELEHKK
ncbi:hypothetical protein Leryth_022976 [Lithospermum erythrorhizon]|nr:hypothetical protein Leryth_022976 [Lithospermum erythrorhizon]